MQTHFRMTAAVASLAAVLAAGCNRSPQQKESAHLKRGESLLAKKDYTRAILEFRNAAQAMPKDAEPYYRIGLAYLATQNAAPAVEALRKATELNPNHAGAQLKLAELMVSSRNRGVLEEAVARLQSILTSSPENTEAIDTLAVAEWQLGKGAQAEKRLEAALEKFPASLSSSIGLARLRLGRRDYQGAEAVLRQAVAAAPQSAEASLALGEMLVMLERPADAERELRRTLTLDSQNGPALLSLGAMAAEARRMDEADGFFRRAAALPGKNYRPLHAIFLFQTGHRDEAVLEFEQLVREDPGDKTTRVRLIAAYLAMDQLPKAESVLGAVLKKNPRDADALLERSGLYLKTGRIVDAETDLKAVIHLQPKAAAPHFVLAAVYRAKGSPRTERQELNEALQRDPTLLPARLALSRSFLASGDGREAIRVLDEAPAQQRRTLATVVERNWASLSLGNGKEVRVTLDRALSAGRLPELVLQDAVLRLTEKDYAGARASAEEVLGREPEDVRAARILAESLVGLKQPAKAVERLTELAAARPRSAPLQHLLGQWHWNAGNLPAARRALEAALAADSKFTESEILLAQIEQREKRVEEARSRLAKVVGSDPGNVPALLTLAGLEDQAGNRPAAVARYRAALNVDGANLFALNNLAYHLAVDDPDEALKYAQQAVELAPDNPAVQDTMGWVYYRKGVYGTAVEYLKTAVAKESTPRRQFHLAMSYIKAGQNDLGQRTLRDALLQDPSLAKTERGW